MKCKITETITRIEEYTITNEIVFKKTFVDNILIDNQLIYIGKNLGGYGLSVLYDFDVESLKVENPFQSKGGYPSSTLPDNPNDIDVSKLMYAQSATHTFYDLEKNFIPVITRCEFWSSKYDVNKLKSYLETHDKVVSVLNTNTPYYNVDICGNETLVVFVLPTIQDVNSLKDKVRKIYDLCNVFKYEYYRENMDWLNIGEFIKPEK